MWKLYAKLLSVIIICRVLVATFSNFPDGESDSIWMHASRILFLLPLAYGLFIQNRWAIRLCYILGFIHLFVIITIIGFHVLPTAPNTFHMTMSFAYGFLHSALFFYPLKKKSAEQPTEPNGEKVK